ncbi:hypothetical protein RJ55_02324 [Drechmeria coniospora]|nr:hypothetical protein RJ55_02324 [Drechmeria coniospora]
MASGNEEQTCQPSSPRVSPTLAIGACPDLSRCVSIASSASHGSHTDMDVASRDSLGSDLTSRHSSGSFHSHSDLSNLSAQSSCSGDRKARSRRGYVRPLGTYFAASARSRESVMSLGSIAHLQYYFARTGLLDGKGGQLARKKQGQRSALHLSTVDAARDAPLIVGSDADVDGGHILSPGTTSPGAAVVSSPVEMDGDDGDDFEDSFAESDSGMLPPTVSTYHHKERHVPKPPTIVELKADLEGTLRNAARALTEAEERRLGIFEEPADAPEYPNMPEENSDGWYRLQGMHILDVVTLAIRAAKMYYTAHEMPDRLDSIKPERQVRADLLAVMEVLKQMATRDFKGGMKEEEIKTMRAWVDSVFGILRKEEEVEEAEKAEQGSWTWLGDDWAGSEYERERAFLLSMDPEAGPLPEWRPLAEAPGAPTAFLLAMQSGLRLVKLHNAAVKKSRRRFGTIPTYHTDTQKPYRCADNLRYWVKAAELRFEVLLKVDALGIVYDNGPEVWQDFEAALLTWCRHVREEIVSDMNK